jgi:hypothetical protein
VDAQAKASIKKRKARGVYFEERSPCLGTSGDLKKQEGGKEKTAFKSGVTHFTI